jgi:pimeloyl-ACP methyl ester carboxylesterase
MYAAEHGDRVERLILFAPVYDTYNRAWTDGLAAEDVPYQLANVGAYRTVTREQADARWAAQIPGDDPAIWRSPEVFERWYDAMLAMEPAEDADHVKAPNGVLEDLWNIFNRQPVYDAGDITVPTLVIRGHADPTSTDSDSRGLFEALDSETKRYVTIGDGSHFINLEKNAGQVFSETLLFLDGSER